MGETIAAEANSAIGVKSKVSLDPRAGMVESSFCWLLGV